MSGLLKTFSPARKAGVTWHAEGIAWQMEESRSWHAEGIAWHRRGLGR